MSQKTGYVLGRLVNLCEDARGVYEVAAQEAQDPFLEDLLYHLAHVKYDMSINLIKCAKQTDRRGLNTSSRLDDVGTLSEIESGCRDSHEDKLVYIKQLAKAEEDILNQFTVALSNDLPSQARSFLAGQIRIILKTRNNLAYAHHKLRERAL